MTSVGNYRSNYFSIQHNSFFVVVFCSLILLSGARYLNLVFVNKFYERLAESRITILTSHICVMLWIWLEIVILLSYLLSHMTPLSFYWNATAIDEALHIFFILELLFLLHRNHFFQIFFDCKVNIWVCFFLLFEISKQIISNRSTYILSLIASEIKAFWPSSIRSCKKPTSCWSDILNFPILKLFIRSYSLSMYT
jgi:hypothetical protein